VGYEEEASGSEGTGSEEMAGGAEVGSERVVQEVRRVGRRLGVVVRVRRDEAVREEGESERVEEVRRARSGRLGVVIRARRR
jgi:hypothetical protein